MSDITRIKDKLAKLLRLGEDTAASQGEIDNALTLATQMMAKYQITREDIDTSAADPTAKVTLGRHTAFCKGANLATWELILSNFVCDFIGSVKAYDSGKQTVRRAGIADFFGATNGEARQAASRVFYGSDEDARCAVDLFEELSQAIATMAIIRWGGWARGDGAAYAGGFATALRDANRKAREELHHADATTSALMIRSEANSLAIVNHAERWLATTHGVKLRTLAKRTMRFSSSNASKAYGEGRKDGANYNVSRPGARQRIG
jgi:hypothetical protein